MGLAQGPLRDVWGSPRIRGTTSKMAHSHRGWLEASVPHHMDFSTDFLKCPHNMAAGFPWIRGFRERAERKRQCLRRGMPYFCHILLVAQTNSDTVWEGTTRKCEYQEVRIVGSHLEAGCHITSVESSLWACKILLCFALWEGEGHQLLLGFVTEAPILYTISSNISFFKNFYSICPFLRSTHETMREAGLGTHPRGRCLC